MRLIPVSILAVILLASAFMPGGARAEITHQPANGTSMLRQSTPIDQHEDSRVGVQLVVAGIAAGVVVGVGTGAYLLRRKLGLTAYDAEQAGGGHH